LEEKVGELAPLKIPLQLRLLAAEAVQVGAGAEDFACARNDDDADLWVGLRLREGLAEFDDSFRAERVAVVGTVDGDRGHRATAPGKEVFERHLRKYMARDFGRCAQH